MDESRQDEVRKRFHLREGQLFGSCRVRNVWWCLNGEKFGFGDLRESDIFLISQALEPGEVFEGFHENHMTPLMRRESPLIRVTPGDIVYPDWAPLSDETWGKIKKL